MKFPIDKLLVASVLFAVSTVSYALPDISGHWQCRSIDPVKKSIVIASGDIQKTGDTWSLINWKDEGTNDDRSGTGLHNSKLKDSFAVMFWSNKNAEDAGFGLYQIQSKDKITGMWTMKNGKITMEETCERMKA